MWPSGHPSAEDLTRVFLRKPRDPFTQFVIQDSTVTLWTTLGKEDGIEQIDLDLNSSATKKFLSVVIHQIAEHGIKTLRLDAIGYVVKKAESSRFFV